MTEELEKLRDYIQVEKPHPDQLEGIVSDIVLKDRSARDLLIKLCIRTGVFQMFIQESTHDLLFINRCKTKLVNEHFISDTAAEKGIQLCKFLVSDKQFDDLPELIPYRKGHKWGYCDRNKMIIIPPQFDSVNLFKEGFAIVYIEFWPQNGPWDCGTFAIDKTGLEISERYDFLFTGEFIEGLARVDLSGSQWGFIDNIANIVISPIYYEIGNFTNGLAPFSKWDGKWGFINKTGKEIISAQYDEVGVLKEGLIRVREYDEWGYIDRNGKEIIPCKYGSVSDFENGYASVNYHGFFGNCLIDKSGSIICEYEYHYIHGFKEGLALASLSLENEIGFINISGEIVIPFIYDQADDFVDGLACVELNGRKGFIDKIGLEIIPFKYEQAKSFRNGLACVGLKNKFGFINKTGKEIIPLKYDETEDFNEGLARVKLNNEWGFIDKNGTEYWEE